jgi:hypothetical protein
VNDWAQTIELVKRREKRMNIEYFIGDQLGESAFKFLMLTKRKVDSFHSEFANILILEVTGKYLIVILENHRRFQLYSSNFHTLY